MQAACALSRRAPDAAAAAWNDLPRVRHWESAGNRSTGKPQTSSELWEAALLSGSSLEGKCSVLTENK